MPKKCGKNKIPMQNSNVISIQRTNRFFVIGWQIRKTMAILIPPPIIRFSVETTRAGSAKTGFKICTATRLPTRSKAHGREIRRTCLRNPVVVTVSCCSNVKKKLGMPIAVALIRLS